MNREVTAYVGLGSNLGDRCAAITSGIAALGAAEEIAIVAVSRIIETAPVGPVAQGPYLNAVVGFRTRLAARDLLGMLLDIERAHGRERDGDVRWGPRTLDLDLLLYGDEIIDEPGLTVPHPCLHERLFVLEPLADIAPALEHPAGLGPITDLRDALRRAPNTSP